MKYFWIKLTVMAVFVALLGACSSCDSTTETNPGNSDQAMVPKEDNNGNPYAVNGERKIVPYNGIENVDTNVTLDNSKVKVVDTKSVDTTIRKKKMPENSEMTTEMNKQGHVLETRTFIDNQFLDKIVKTTINPKNVTLKIYFKDGEVKEIPPEALGNFRIAAVGTIMKAAGREIPADKNAPTKSEVMKKRAGGNP